MKRDNLKFLIVCGMGSSIASISLAKPVYIEYGNVANTIPTIESSITKDSMINTTSGLDDTINTIAAIQGISPSLVRAIIKCESSYNPLAVSPKGAVGLMQVLPSTASMYGNYNLYKTHDNIMAGTKHLGYLLRKYKKLPYAIAAYNAGEGNVDKYNGVPPFIETQNYVYRVLKAYNNELDGVVTKTSSPTNIKLTRKIADFPSIMNSQITNPVSRKPKVILLNL